MQLIGRLPGMPATFGGTYGYIGAPLDGVADAAEQWFTSLGFTPRRTSIDGGLVAAAPSLLPLSDQPYGRVLFVQTTQPTWTAVFDASPRGGDPRGALNVLGRRLEAPHLLVSSMPFAGTEHVVPGLLGSRIWEYSPGAGETRALALVEGEGKRARFEAHGPAQPCEDHSAYTARRVADRLTPQLVDTYSRAVGVRPFDVEFHRGPAVLLERTT